MKSHPYRNPGSGKSRNGSRFYQDRRLRADGFIIRTQSAIRADGCRPRQIKRCNTSELGGKNYVKWLW